MSDDPYVIKAPTPKPDRPTTILERIESKLDRIIGGNEGGDNDDISAGDNVTFSPDPDSLPTNDSVEPENDDDDPTGGGEGSHNISHPVESRAFRHPSAKRSRVEIEA